MTARAHRLLLAAKAFHDAPAAEPVDAGTRETARDADDVDGTLRKMAATLWQEARSCMRSPLPNRPDALDMHVLDLDSEQPAIVLSSKPRRCLVLEPEAAEAGPIPYSSLYAPQEVIYPDTPPAQSAPPPLVQKPVQGVLRRAEQRAARHVAQMQRLAHRAEEQDERFGERQAAKRERSGRQRRH